MVVTSHQIQGRQSYKGIISLIFEEANIKEATTAEDMSFLLVVLHMEHYIEKDVFFKCMISMRMILFLMICRLSIHNFYFREMKSHHDNDLVRLQSWLESLDKRSTNVSASMIPKMVLSTPLPVSAQRFVVLFIQNCWE